MNEKSHRFLNTSHKNDVTTKTQVMVHDVTTKTQVTVHNGY